MHGNVNEVCGWLLENYIPGCTLTVLVWTIEDVEVCSEEMGITEQESVEVLRRISLDENYIEHGINGQTVWEHLSNIRAMMHQVREVSFDARSLQTLAEAAGRLVQTGGEDDPSTILQAVAQARMALNR
ncbi:DUF1380 family protein [Pantoea allii]|uniref:DUF1380 domain-containing protein n=1 Tax=Pantoea allii TaxID=574096 RepID=A0ABS6VMT1_9GAMM|nr:DUF1380 family protein [Pantoea allii]MBW1216534.1 DUF1380 domain-containing protein [Pantoea allii]MBW1260117.1 DUF1380 domain-containing protein [Pantoea allii]MBW1269196.1 DUF1380 domain-containing protein [Pantoea allii]MBW1291322.1 DUF1380 domain-containing protein [Pantoea allii]